MGKTDETLGEIPGRSEMKEKIDQIEKKVKGEGEKDREEVREEAEKDAQEVLEDVNEDIDESEFEETDVVSWRTDEEYEEEDKEE